MTSENLERMLMEKAIEEMEKSDGNSKVGAVLVVGGRIVAAGHKGPVFHAEREAIKAAQDRGLELRNAVLYTTLEPCVEMKSGQSMPCCADLIISAGIRQVTIGRYDPNPSIRRKGWKQLLDAGIKLRDFPKDLRHRIDAINKFMSFFSSGTGPEGCARVDHKELAKFRVRFAPDDHRYMDICWTICDAGSAYGYAFEPVKVALARFAANFRDIDDPTAYDFNYTARIGVGEIGIFLGPEACVLVKPKEVQSGPAYGSNDYFVKFDYLVRLLA